MKIEMNEPAGWVAVVLIAGITLCTGIIASTQYWVQQSEIRKELDKAAMEAGLVQEQQWGGTVWKKPNQ